jgi:hypothetical protein
MTKENFYDDLQGLYSLSKTLRFELKPVGKTLENIERDEVSIVKKDEARAAAYKRIKTLLDEYHKDFIQRALKSFIDNGGFDFSQFNIENYKAKDMCKEISNYIQKEFNKIIDDRGKRHPEYEYLFGKEVFTADLLLNFHKNKSAEDKELIKVFYKWTTYFTGFNENRANIYKDNTKGSIAMRVVDENLKMFLYNVEKYKQLNKVQLTDHEKEIFKISYFNKCITQNGIDDYNKIIGGYSKEDGTKVQGINEKINLYCQRENIKLPRLKQLYKQIMCDRETNSFVYQPFESENDIIGAVNAMVEFYKGIDLSIVDNIETINNKYLTALSTDILEDWSALQNKLSEISGCTKNKDKLKKYLKQDFKLEEINKVLTEDEQTKLKEYINKIKDKEIIKEISTFDVPTIKDVLDKIKAHYDKLLMFNLEIEDFDNIIAVYNKTRNFCTKKPFSTDKVKLNFNCQTLGAGWDLNKEGDNLCVILIKDNKYYLAVMDKQHNKIFKDYEYKNENDFYNKVDYKLFPSPNKMCPKCFFASSFEDDGKEGAEKIINKKREGNYTYTKDDEQILIKYYKHCLNKVYEEFNFTFKDKYDNLNDFFQNVENQGYKLSYSKISTDYINQKIESGELYLFELYNKDFSQFSKGTPNLHTLYWKALFDEKNFKNGAIYKLCGGAEIFYRKGTIDNNKKIVHHKNQAIQNKNELNEKKTSTFNYDLIKDRRYTEDKFLFHCPIQLNFVNAHYDWSINELVNQNIDKCRNIIGIDRGERNLIYVVLIGTNEEIKQQISFNEIINEYKGNTYPAGKSAATHEQVRSYKTDYRALLDKKEIERQQARVNWGNIENIKELKDGYISQVVHKICEMAIENQAIICMEDLNDGFKNSRKKFEKQVYQKFEKALLEKLNYYVDKKQSDTLWNAKQLTNKFKSFQKLTNQSGIVFYVSAWKTSKIDPTTGFVDELHPKYESVDKAKQFIKKFDSISKENNLYKFAVDYKNFMIYDKAKTPNKTQWNIYSYGERIASWRNNNHTIQYEVVDLTKKFDELFNKYNITEISKENILKESEVDFYKTFMRLFGLTLQLRNSKKATATEPEQDYLISPVKNKDEKFFDSRKADEDEPKDADANGAYNIARRGIMAINKIKGSQDKSFIKFDKDNKSYLDFISK